MASSGESPNIAAELVAVRDGDREALGRLLGRIEEPLTLEIERQLGPWLRGKVRPSDILQNVYLEVVRLLPSFEGEHVNQLVAWANTIVRSEVLRQHRWFSAARRAQPERTSERNRLARELQPDVTTPSRLAQAREEGALLATALAQLPEAYSTVIELAVVQELPHAEVAARMGRSEGATRMLLMRARAQLGLELERLEGDPEDSGERKI